MSSKVWFITGASRGFGRIWAEAALKRGDKVTATARKLEDIADLKNRFGEAVLPLALDVTDSEQVPKSFSRRSSISAGKQFLARLANLERGDPEATAEAALKLVDTNDPPLRLGLGNSILPRAREGYAARLATWEAWEDVSNAAMGEPKRTTTEWIEQLAQSTPVRA